MRKTSIKKDFSYYIDEYMYYCQSRRLRPKMMNSYELPRATEELS